VTAAAWLGATFGCAWLAARRARVGRYLCALKEKRTLGRELFGRDRHRSGAVFRIELAE
jgi:hypothetical protein